MTTHYTNSLKKHINTLLISFLLTSLHQQVQAQQSSQLSQYMLNPVVINPAIAGAESYMDVTLAYRNQWTGLTGAPRTGTLTFNAPVNALFNRTTYGDQGSHAGIGAFIYSDKAGPINRSGYYGNFAYHIQITNKWLVSLGAFVGKTQFSFDDSDVQFVQTPNDPLVQSISVSNFDASVGIFLYSDVFFAGVSANQIFDQDIPLVTTGGTIATGKISSNYNLLAGGRLSLNKEWQLVPSVLLKSEENTPIQWDLNAKATYNNKFWIGGSYRNEESIYMLAGVQFWEAFSISYSYDVPFSRISGFQSGSHEIVVSYRFFGNYKEKCYCPRYAM